MMQHPPSPPPPQPELTSNLQHNLQLPLKRKKNLHQHSPPLGCQNPYTHFPAL